jgi:cystathionine gamma-lyase
MSAGSNAGRWKRRRMATLANWNTGESEYRLNEAKKIMQFATRAIHVGQDPDPSTGATVPPIHVTTTYTQAGPEDHKGFEYSRQNNPTRQQYESVMSALEGGAGCAAFASGLAATTAVLSLLRPGENVVAYADVYGGTYRLMERVFKHWGIEARYTDESSAESFVPLIDGKTKLVWIESPTNPLLRVLDIAAISDVTHASGAKLAVDNTFATPALQQPIALGADYVVHSTTKYIGGHSDVVGGVVVVKDEADLEPIAFFQNAAGGVPGPFDVYLAHRGVKTLQVRMQRHVENARKVATFLEEHPKTERVYFPGSPSHPDFELAERQMCGPGGMVTAVMAGGRDACHEFCKRVRLFAFAESLGGVESLLCHPVTMTHGSIPKEIREGRGIVDSLVRFSVGIEAVEDLLEDIDQALR